MITKESNAEKSGAQYRVTRWYPKKDDDMIIERWADACSEKHESCRDCVSLEECQDLVDRLITCMEVRPPRHREVIGREE